MTSTKWYCDCCFHPVSEGQTCPFCSNNIQTKECLTCKNIMLALPTPLTKEKVQYICQQCEFEHALQK